MLPEKLSNNICSLNPHEDKLCFSVVVRFDKDLKTVLSTWIGKTIINSNRRFTYNDANSLISKTTDGEFGSAVITLISIAKNLRMSRIKTGSIDYESSLSVFPAFFEFVSCRQKRFWFVTLEAGM